MNNTMPPSSAEITIVGAGILGLINALQYAKRGIPVVLIDDLAGKKRSYKVGESLLIFSNAFLRTIGELDDFLVHAFPKNGVWFLYGAEGATDFSQTTEWAYQTTLPPRWSDAMANKTFFRSLFYDAQMVRPEAEDLLIETVRKYPLITFLDTSLVKDVILGENDDLHEVHWESQQTHETGIVHSRWVLDCSGRRRLLAKKFQHDIPDIRDDFRTTAVWGQFGQFSDALFDERWEYQYPDGGSTLRDRNTCHFWSNGAWIWLIRLTGDRVSIGVTFDQRTPPEGRSYKEQFWNVINRYPLLRDKISKETQLEMRTYKDVQYMTDTFVSPRRYGMVGDAASIIDAYYSQGISLAFASSWHIANIVQEDLQSGQLDTDYIRQVNRATVQDWRMMRNMVRTKFSPAITDSRFFLLSHLLDFTIFACVAGPRYRLTKWLAETGGESSKETAFHKRQRQYLHQRLYFSQTPPWHWLPAVTIQKVQRHWQEKLAQRAIWRIEHENALPPLTAIVRVSSFIPLIRKLMFGHKAKIDISPNEIVEPAWVRIKGTETQPFPTYVGGIAQLNLFLSLYFWDWVDTGRRKLLFRLGGKKRQLSSNPIGQGEPVLNGLHSSSPTRQELTQPQEKVLSVTGEAERERQKERI